MDDEPTPKAHDLESVWVNIRNTQRDVAGMGATLESILQGQKDLNGAVRSILSKPVKDTNWVGIGSLVVALILVVGVYTQARFLPVEAVIEKHDRQIMSELEASAEHRYNAGVRDGKLATMEKVLTEFIETTYGQLTQLTEKQAGCSAKAQAIHDQLNAVDILGSRKHVISAGSL